MHQKINGFITIGILLIIVLVLAAAGGTFYLSRSVSTDGSSSGAQGTYTDPTFGFTLSYPLSVGINVNESSETRAGQDIITAKFHSPQQNNPVLVTVTLTPDGNRSVSGGGTLTLNGVSWNIATNTVNGVNAGGQKDSSQVVTAVTGIPGRYLLELERMVGTEGLDADLTLIKNIAGSIKFTEADLRAVDVATQELNAQRSAANITAIRSGLDMIHTAALIYRDSHSGYGTQSWTSGVATACTGGMFSDSTVTNMLRQADALNGSGNIDCYANGTSYFVGVDLTAISGNNSWSCVDSTGTYRVESSAFPTTAPAGYVCP